MSKTMTPANKKRKIDGECREFNESWTLDYFFIEHCDKSLCLICNEVIAVKKEYNIKRHYQTKHPNFDSKEMSGKIRKDKVAALQRNREKQKGLFTKQSTVALNNTLASYAVSSLIAKRMKPFSDGEFLKDCMLAVVDIVCPEKRSLFSNISLSASTVTRRCDDISDDVKSSLKDRISKFEFYSLALDESTDAKDTAQLAVFVRGVDKNFDITEEFAGIVGLRDTTTGEDVFNGLKTLRTDIGLSLDKQCGVTTDGAPAMVGKQKGLVSIMDREMKDAGIDQKLYKTHCIIHQEALCAKSVKMQDVMKVVVKTVNFVRSRGLNHRQFQKLLEEVNAQYGDLLYYCEVRWLSRGAMLQRFYSLRAEIVTFMKQKDNPVPEMEDDEWLSDLAFLTDITTHLNELNKSLQGRDQLISNMFESVSAFEVKLRLWETQLKRCNYAHFPTLKENPPQNGDDYVTFISDLRTQFATRFGDLRACKSDLTLFSSPFSVDVDETDENVQMELIELQSSSHMKDKFNSVPLLQFYKDCVSEDSYPKLRCHAKKMACLFGSSYVCEQLFSRMKYVKCKSRTMITDTHLDGALRLATSSLEPNLQKLAKGGQAQVSH